MPEFILTYRARAGYTPGSEDAMAAWQKWFDDMGPALADIGKPVFSRTTLGNCGAGATVLGGYSIIRAGNLESAAALAKGCPFIDDNGGVEVGELSDLAPRP